MASARGCERSFMVKMARFAWREMSRIVGKRMEKFKESPRHIHVVACCPCSWPLGRKFERSRDKTQGHVCDEKSSSPPQTRLSFANVRCLAVCELEMKEACTFSPPRKTHHKLPLQYRQAGSPVFVSRHASIYTSCIVGSCRWCRRTCARDGRVRRRGDSPLAC